MNDASWWMAMLLATSLGAASTVSCAADQSDPAGMRSAPAGQTDATAEDLRSAAARHGGKSTDPDHAGIWKAATPPSGTMHGEFENNDPVGLSTGVSIKADCSINWVDPDFGKRYCFSTATSLVVFLDAPRAYLSLAVKRWGELHRGTAR